MEADDLTSGAARRPAGGSSNSPVSSALSRSPVFGTTLWSIVLAAGNPNHPGSAAALDRLCRMYWYPVYAYVRRKGRIAAEAEDLTQEFFFAAAGEGIPRRRPA